MKETTAQDMAAQDKAASDHDAAMKDKPATGDIESQAKAAFAKMVAEDEKGRKADAVAARVEEMRKAAGITPQTRADRIKRAATRRMLEMEASDKIDAEVEEAAKAMFAAKWGKPPVL